MSELSNHRINEFPSRWALWLLVLAIIGFALLMFRQVLIPGVCLFASDNNIGQMILAKETLPGGLFFGFWSDKIYLGKPKGMLPVNWNALLSWVMSPMLYANWGNAICFVLASFFLALWLRDRQAGWCAIVVGFLTAFWLGSNLTLTYAGHTGKFGVLLMASVTLYCVSRALYGKPSWLWAILSGWAIGWMFVEQLDVALFFSFALGAYALFLAIRRWQINRTWAKSAVALILMGGVGLMLSASTMFSGYTANVKGAASMQTESPVAKWEFVTQWSWPPDECIDFIAPGYMGWRSGEPAGPYWGRMGRSAGWEQTRQGFMNFKLENMYLGIIPILLALFAILMAATGFKNKNSPPNTPNDTEDANRRAEIIFWGCVTGITLLLSFGKFFPLYALFYKLPFVNSIRNPNKFLQVFQLALGILTAYGLDALIRISIGLPADNKAD